MLTRDGRGDPVFGIIVRLPKVKTDPAFAPVRTLPEGREMATSMFSIGQLRLSRVVRTENAVRRDDECA
jgi:hypothetical protein